MRIFRTKVFTRFANKESIDDSALCAAVRQAEVKPDAELGGGVIKQRVARKNKGKSGGYRTIIVFRKGSRAVFVYGFAKSTMANIDAKQRDAFKKLAPTFLDASESMLVKMLKSGEIAEVSCHDEEGPDDKEESEESGDES